MKRIASIVLAVAALAMMLPFMSGTASADPVGPWDINFRYSAWDGTTGTGVGCGANNTRGLKISAKMSVPSGDTTVYRLDVTVFLGGGFGGPSTRQFYMTASGTTRTLDATLDNNPSPPYGGGCESYGFPATSLTTVKISIAGVVQTLGIDGSTELLGTSHVTSNGANTTPALSAVAAPYASGVFATPATPNFTVGACSRKLDTTATMIGQFTATVTPLTGTTDTYSWVWGDGSTAGTSKTMNHTYPAIGSQPTNGWTATLTVTRTGDGIIYSASPTKTATCSLRIDFLNPGASDPASSGINDDSDCPSGWGFLNPLAIVQVLKCLFIPSGPKVASMGVLWGDMTTRAPFSYAYQIVQFPATVIDAFHDGLVLATSSDSGGTNCNDFTFSHTPKLGTGEYPITADGTCAAMATINADSTSNMIFGWMHTIVYILFLGALAFTTYNLVTWAIK